MRKALIFILMLLVTICICAYVGLLDNHKWQKSDILYKESNDVWMETQYAVYPENTTSVLVKWFNESKDDLTGGEPFTLEKQVFGVWRTVSKVTDINYGFTLLGYPLPAGESYWQEYDLIPYTDGLSAGKYRISSDVSIDYPQGIQVYGYFKVGKAAELRSVTHEDGTYEYVNPEFGFVLPLTPDWTGCKTEIVNSTGDSELDALCETISEGWFALRIRHPNWSEGTPYQDIVLAGVSGEDWNAGNLEKAVGTNYELLPERISTDWYMLMFSKSNLDSSLEGYDTAFEALKTMKAIR